MAEPSAPMRERHPQPVLSYFQPRVTNTTPTTAETDGNKKFVNLKPFEKKDLLRRRYSGSTSSTDFFDKRIAPGVKRDPDDLKVTEDTLTPNVLFQIPVVNLVWTFLDDEIEPPSWDQIATMLDTFLFVLALCIALNCTYMSAISFGELRGADTRFQYAGFGGNEWDSNWTVVVGDNQIDKYSRLNSLADASLSNVKDIESAQEGMEKLGLNWNWAMNATPWSITKRLCFDNTTNSTESCIYDVTCQYPCFYPRYDADVGVIDSQWYALWSVAEGKGDLPFSTTVAATLNLSNSFLFCSLFLAIFTRALGAPNVFFGGDEHVVQGHQYRIVSKSYFYWARWTLIILVFTAVIGVLLFIEGTKLFTYIKYPDMYVVQNRGAFNWIVLFPAQDSPFSQAQSYVVNFFFIPMAIGAFFLSFGHRAAYLYPTTSQTSLSHPSMMKKRYKLQKDMITFLRVECGLPSSTTSDSPRPGPPPSLFEKFSLSHTQRLYSHLGRVGVFLTGAGGLPATEAEVVADILIDSGFTHPEDLVELKIHGLESELYGLPGMHANAANYIIKWLLSITDVNWSEFKTSQPIVKGDNLEYYDLKEIVSDETLNNSVAYSAKFLPTTQAWDGPSSPALLKFNVDMGYRPSDKDNRYTVGNAKDSPDFRAGRNGDLEPSPMFVQIREKQAKFDVGDINNTAFYRPE